VASQIAFACLLLVCGGLLMRSLHNLLQVDLGFDPRGAVVLDLSLPQSRYPDGAANTRFYRELTRELASTPGVASAGGLLYFPYKPKLWPSAIWVEDAPSIEGQEPVVYYNLIAADYFAAMGIPVLEGRTPTPEEMWERRQVILINQALARQFFPNRSPLGRRIRTDRNGLWFEIIGVVGDVRQERLDEPAAAEFYVTFSRNPLPFLTLVVRAERNAADIAEPVRQTVRRLDAGLAIAGFAPLEDYVKARTSDRRAAVWLLGGFALLALGLGAIGIYGVISYAVAERRREIAVRLALGAAPGGVQAMVLRDGLRVALVGTVVGLLGAWLTSRYLQILLFGVGGFDGPIYGAVAVALLAVAAVASWLPARRASRVQALAALQSE
jgi:predicted permease